MQLLPQPSQPLPTQYFQMYATCIDKRTGFVEFCEYFRKNYTTFLSAQFIFDKLSLEFKNSAILCFSGQSELELLVRAETSKVIFGNFVLRIVPGKFQFELKSADAVTYQIQPFTSQPIENATGVVLLRS